MAYTKFIKMDPIQAGWSDDKKYHAIQADGTEVLYRVSEEDLYESKRMEFAMMRNVEILGVPICLPLDFGLCEEGVYTILSWIEGEMAEAVIPSMSEENQYGFGVVAGENLRKIHTIPAPEHREDWDVRFNESLDERIRDYNKSPIKITGGQDLIAYIEENRKLLRNRPQCFQHGDFHIGNMMFEDGELVIIDFDRFNYGDPWEDFNRISWSAGFSPYFASGIIDGYFQKEIPEEFWRLLALYVASNTIASVAWARKYGERQIDIIMHQANDVIRWYKNMTVWIPTWYSGKYRWKTTNDITGLKKN